MHETIVSLLEFFEVIYKMKIGTEMINGKRNEEQMFFVPSLLSPFLLGNHPALQFWNLVEPMYD